MGHHRVLHDLPPSSPARRSAVRVGLLGRKAGAANAAVPQRSFEGRWHVVAGDLDRGKIDPDGERQRLSDLAIPSAERLRRGVQRPAAERDDQPRFLGDGNEFGGRDRSALFMVPAGERLEARYLARSEIDQRLEIEPQLVTLDRPPEFRRSEEHTSELQSLMRISYAVFCLKKKTNETH